jgi:hypothetical protein
MDINHKLGHVASYYLSRFDKDALLALNFKTDKEAFTKIAESLGLLPNYIKFRRDEFDVAHPRKLGWHKRPMTPSIQNTITGLKDLDERTLREIVKDILRVGVLTIDSDRLASIFPVEEKNKRKARQVMFIPRGITGRKAEEHFVLWYGQNADMLPGSKFLKDTRDDGCGYDFELAGLNGEIYCLEIKGLASGQGGIMFTNKEWETAVAKSDGYYLILISNIDADPVVNIIKNPAANTSPKRNLVTVVQVNWNVSATEITNAINKTS